MKKIQKIKNTSKAVGKVALTGVKCVAMTASVVVVSVPIIAAMLVRTACDKVSNAFFPKSESFLKEINSLRRKNISSDRNFVLKQEHEKNQRESISFPNLNSINKTNSKGKVLEI